MLNYSLFHIIVITGSKKKMFMFFKFYEGLFKCYDKFFQTSTWFTATIPCMK